ncbi:lipopolysaccharide biosynthesis protein [Arthrobacter sp. AD-310]
MTPGGDLARAGASGAMWQGLAFVSGRLIVLATTVVLARLLSPEEYGLVAFALVLMLYTESVADAGVAQALVYLPRTKVMAQSALLISLGLGTSLALIVALGAPLTSEVFGFPAAVPLIQVISVSIFATSCGAVPEALLRRDLRFRQLTAAPVIRAALMGSVTLLLAFQGQGALSLALGTVAGSVGYAATCWYLVRHDAPWRFWRSSWHSIRANLSFGAPVAGSSLLARLIFDVDYLIIGLVLGAQALGYYTLAFRLPEALILNVFFVLSTVLFPLYTQVRDDPYRLRAGYLKSMQIQALYGVPAGVGLAVLAPVLVPLLFGPQWGDAVLPLTLLAIYAAVRSLGAGANDVYKALGRPGLSITISIIRLLILVPVLFFATQWGIAGIASAQLAVAVIFAVGMQTVAAKVIRIRTSMMFQAVLPGLVCGAAVAVSGLITLVLPLLGGAATAVLVIFVALPMVYLILRLGFPELHKDLLTLVRLR